MTKEFSCVISVEELKQLLEENEKNQWNSGSGDFRL